MKASHAWLRDLSGVDASPEQMAERLTRAGVEVERITRHGEGLDRVVIAEVRGRRPHPSRDRLTVVTVWDGRQTREVVCGAANVPEAGARVLLAEVGARLPGGLEIGAREVAGVRSEGMLCSEAELDIGPDASGIVVLDRGTAGKVGAPAAEALRLRDAVLELSLTPNRPDCLGHVGLAREICLSFDVPFVLRAPPAPQRILASDDAGPAPAVAHLTTLDPTRGHPGETLNLVRSVPGAPLSIPIVIEAPDRCARYLGLVLQHVEVGPSPLWVRHRLHLLGQRPIDRVVDATNLILLETGHPIHAFDLEALRGPAIVVRRARQGERILTLDDVERTLSDDDLVIADAERPVAIAGVMGGRASGVSAATRLVLLEVAWFDPRSVRRTSRRHGLHTEASHRFERGCDPGALEHVMRSAAALLGAIAGAAASPICADASARRIAPVAIALHPRQVGALIGAPVAASEARRILEGVGCRIAPAEDDGWRVIAPTHRPDLLRPEDLVEEIARVRGYDRIPEALAPVAPRAEAPEPRFRILRRIREAAAAAGLFEAVNFAFASRRQLRLARAPDGAVELDNPLSEERAVLRTSLLPGLLGDVVRAQRHQARRGALFEVGRTYHAVARGAAHGSGREPDVQPSRGLPRRPEERLAFGLVLFGPRGLWIGDDAPFDVYDAKAMVQNVLGAVGVKAETIRDERLPEDAPWAHPRRSARVVAEDVALGALGEVHPEVAEAFDIAGRPVAALLDLDAVVALAARARPPEARPLPRFPAVLRDLAVVVDEAVQAADVAAAMRAAAPLASGGGVESVELFDVYRGKPVAEGCKSLAFRIAYRDPDATLTDAVVDRLHEAVVRAVADRFGAALRA